tara:strand:+ start:950 stop:1720 length:771 start_codon:yes stop_codon:yes gene_type:complete
MAWGFDDVQVGGQIQVGTGVVPAIGVGDRKINGSAHIEGPIVFGDPLQFPSIYATLMVAPLTNSDKDSKTPKVPGGSCFGLNNSYALAVQGNAAIQNALDASGNITAGANIQAQGNVISNCGGHILAAKKDFDIPHPSRDGYRLRYVAPEAPTADVYYRGRVVNKTYIELPLYWEDLVDPSTITVNLTPIGAHQDVIVKRLEPTKIHLQSRSGVPINCFFHVYGERQDCERNISEYEGTSPQDYPGDNSQYLQSRS